MPNARRSYNQHCALAHALDLVGERWTLLLIRELLFGPRRHKDLLAALEGIGTNLLSARLEHLRREGLVRKVMLPSPSLAPAYELTDRGKALEPVLVALTRWALPTLGPWRRGGARSPAWAVLGLQALFVPESARGLHETYELHAEDEIFRLEVDDGVLKVALGASDRPVLRIRSDGATLSALASGALTPEEASAKGKLSIEGSKATIARFVRMFPPAKTRAASGARQ